MYEQISGSDNGNRARREDEIEIIVKKRGGGMDGRCCMSWRRVQFSHDVSLPMDGVYTDEGSHSNWQMARNWPRWCSCLLIVPLDRASRMDAIDLRRAGTVAIARISPMYDG